MFEILITNAKIVDGTGASPYLADIAVKGDKIDAIGNLASLPAKDIIDASGKIVTPGFIDMHTHSDFTLLLDPRAESAIRQGVTSEVVGQCGFGATPLPDKSIVKNLFGYHPAVEPTWDSPLSYFNTIEKASPAVNMGALVGHAPLRYAAIKGGQGSADQKAIDHMCNNLDEALKIGYFGLSIGLEYEPGIHATTEELLALAKVVAKHDGIFACHVRNRDVYYDMAFSEVISIARQTGVRLQISHISPKYGAPEDAVKNTIDMIERCNRSGARVGFDIIPDNFGPTIMASVLPDWVLEGGIDGALRHLAKESSRVMIKKNPGKIWRLVTDKRWERIYLVNGLEKSSMIGKTIEEIAKENGIKDPFDAILDMLLNAGRDMFAITWAGWNFDENMQKQILSHDLCGVISDARTVAPDGILGSQTGAPSVYGWIPQFFERYVINEKILRLETAVHKLTGLPALRHKIDNRGLLRPGLMADITILDLETIKCMATLKDSRCFPLGIETVIVNGAITLNNSERKKINNGSVLKAV